MFWRWRGNRAQSDLIRPNLKSEVDWRQEWVARATCPSRAATCRAEWVRFTDKIKSSHEMERLPVPLGQWPNGTGGSPVLPILFRNSGSIRPNPTIRREGLKGQQGRNPLALPWLKALTGFGWRG